MIVLSFSEEGRPCDALGNRIEMDVTISGATTVTRYAEDGGNNALPSPVGNEDVNTWAVLSSSNALVTRNIFGDQVNNIIARVDQSGASDTAGQYWDLADSLGSVRDVVNGSGAVEDSITYDGYGNITSQTTATYLGMYAYTGAVYDNYTGLDYDRDRYYEPAIGRFISEDPLGFEAGDANLYRYVDNGPTGATDPSGDMLSVQAGSYASQVLSQIQNLGIPSATMQQVGSQDVFAADPSEVETAMATAPVGYDTSLLATLASGPGSDTEMLQNPNGSDRWQNVAASPVEGQVYNQMLASAEDYQQFTPPLLTPNNDGQSPSASAVAGLATSSVSNLAPGGSGVTVVPTLGSNSIIVSGLMMMPSQPALPQVNDAFYRGEAFQMSDGVYRGEPFTIQNCSVPTSQNGSTPPRTNGNGGTGLSPKAASSIGKRQTQTARMATVLGLELIPRWHLE